MSIAGAKPKDPDRKVTRHPLTHDWIEVLDRPYEGDKPTLPKVVRKGEGWTDATRAWWKDISSMPHCILWTDAEWRRAVDTARLHHLFVTTGRAAAELRIREKEMGVTADSRRDLRIRYVRAYSSQPEREEPGEEQAAPAVSDFAAERRRRLMERGE